MKVKLGGQTQANRKLQPGHLQKEAPGVSIARYDFRRWSGVKVAPSRVLLHSGCGYAEPGQSFYLLTEPDREHARACEDCYRADRADHG